MGSIEIGVASIPTINYKEVIEIRVPTRFYWNDVILLMG